MESLNFIRAKSTDNNSLVYLGLEIKTSISGEKFDFLIMLPPALVFSLV